MVEHDLNKVIELIKNHKISVNELERFIERLPLTEVDSVEFLGFLDEAGKYIEKVKELAIDQATVLKEKTDELLELTKEKATPIINAIAKEVRNSAIVVTKEILKKLESNE